MKPTFFNDLPLEIFNMIVDSSLLDNVDRRSLNMASKALQTSSINTTKPTTKEFHTFNQRFEASIPHFSTNPLAQVLLCQHCNKFHDRSKFPDAHAQRVCERINRTCLRCAIKLGRLNKRCFKYRDKMHFICTACKESKVAETDMAPIEKGTEFTVWQKFGGSRDLELRVNVSERRWCKQCWKTMDGFWKYVGEKGIMREKWHSSAG